MNYNLRKTYLEALYHLGETASVQKFVKAFVDYIQAAIPGASIREESSFSYDPGATKILSIKMPRCHSNWVIIIEQENIKKNNGHNCLKVYHLRSAIPFSVKYGHICYESNALLNEFDFLLSPEAVVTEMILSLFGS